MFGAHSIAGSWHPDESPGSEIDQFMIGGDPKKI